MDKIDFQTQLLPFLISLIGLITLFAIRKFAERKPYRKIIWLSGIVLCGVYATLLLGAITMEIFYGLRYEDFDINHNGLIESSEKTYRFPAAEGNYKNDTARKLVYITGLILAISIALTVLTVGLAKVSVKPKTL